MQSGELPKLLDHTVKAYWEIESLGIVPSEPSVYDEFTDTIQFTNGHYKVRLLWRSSEKRLPSNFSLAKQCLEGLLKRLNHSPEVRCE